MGSSSQSTKSSPWGPTQAPLTNNALPRIEQRYQTASAGGDPLAGARSHTNDVLGGQYLDPNSNPHLGNLVQSISDPIRAQTSAMFSRAGRGTSASSSGLGGAVTRNLATGLAPSLFGQYGQERGLQSQAVNQQGLLAGMGDVNLNQYLDQLRGVASLGGQSSSSASPSGLQTGVGLGLTALSLFSDRRLKTDIESVGKDGTGHKVYGYRYKWDDPGTRRFGVMAGEVEKVNPAAVSRHPSGFKMVDYAALKEPV